MSQLQEEDRTSIDLENALKFSESSEHAAEAPALLVDADVCGHFSEEDEAPNTNVRRGAANQKYAEENYPARWAEYCTQQQVLDRYLTEAEKALSEAAIHPDYLTNLVRSISTAADELTRRSRAVDYVSEERSYHDHFQQSLQHAAALKHKLNSHPQEQTSGEETVMFTGEPQMDPSTLIIKNEEREESRACSIASSLRSDIRRAQSELAAIELEKQTEEEQQRFRRFKAAQVQQLEDEEVQLQLQRQQEEARRQEEEVQLQLRRQQEEVLRQGRLKREAKERQEKLDDLEAQERTLALEGKGNVTRRKIEALLETASQRSGSVKGKRKDTSQLSSLPSSSRLVDMFVKKEDQPAVKSAWVASCPAESAPHMPLSHHGQQGAAQAEGPSSAQHQASASAPTAQSSVSKSHQANGVPPKHQSQPSFCIMPETTAPAAPHRTSQTLQTTAPQTTLRSHAPPRYVNAGPRPPICTTSTQAVKTVTHAGTGGFFSRPQEQAQFRKYASSTFAPPYLSSLEDIKHPYSLVNTLSRQPAVQETLMNPLSFSQGNTNSTTEYLRHDAPEFIPSRQYGFQPFPASQLWVPPHQESTPESPGLNGTTAAVVNMSQQREDNDCVTSPSVESSLIAGLKAVADAIATSSDRTAKVMAETMTANRKPVPKPPVFSGDPLMYPSWIAAFEHHVSGPHVKSADKMLMLRDLLDGPAKRAVGDLYYGLSESAYLNALAMLKRRFGKDYEVSEALKKKLEDWPAIKAKDSAALREFADCLKQCLVLSEKIEGLSIYEDPAQIKRLVFKLPDALTLAWSRKVMQLQRAAGLYPPFEDFVSFMEDEAEVLCDANLKGGANVKRAMATGTKEGAPHVNQGGRNGKKKTEEQLHEGNVSSHNTGSKEPVVCVYCKGLHCIVECGKFEAIEDEAKREFIRCNKLCYRCLDSTHFRRGCVAKLVCQHCGRYHLTILHGVATSPRINNYQYQRSGNHASSSGQTGQQGNWRDSSPRFFGSRGNAPQNSPQGPQGASSPMNSTQPHQAPSNQPAMPQGQPRASQQVVASNNTIHSKPEAATVCRFSKGSGRYYSLYVPVWLSSRSNSGSEELVYAMLDTMSDTTFVVEDVADRLNAPFRAAQLVLSTLNAQGTTSDCRVYQDLQVRPYNGSTCYSIPIAYSRETICERDEQIPTRQTIEGNPSLRHLSRHFQPLFKAPIALLLGINVASLLMPIHTVKAATGDAFAMETQLGWGLLGTLEEQSHEEEEVRTYAAASPIYVRSYSVKDTTTEKLVRAIERDFSSATELPASQEDTRFIEILRESIKINVEGHYEMPLPFKGQDPLLPDNRQVAERRLLSLRRKFQRDSEHLRLYQEFMAQIIDRRDAERVPEDEIINDKKWYIPHHGVYNPNKPGKVRVVFDCAAKCQGQALNDHLLTGPDLLNSLIGVLCRFRLFPVAVSCDVEKMYHQFHVSPRHRDYLRFLWWPNGDLSQSPAEYRMRVHLFGAASSPGCANYAFKQLARDEAKMSEESSRFIHRDFYVDDGLSSCQTEMKAIHLIKGARAICEKGNLRLHKIASNSESVLKAFPASEVVKAVNIEPGGEKIDSLIERTLGVRWMLEGDTLHFNFNGSTQAKTRRGVLSVIASVFDPLGLISPLVLQGRMILQEICREGLDWDDQLSEGLQQRWIRWLENMEGLHEIHIPRCYFKQASLAWADVQLHHFADASVTGYGECSYLRVVDSKSQVYTALVISKAKVAPLKTVTVPRLELQAAVLAVQIARFLSQEFSSLPLTHYFWSDSKVVLGYIYNETKRFHTFVANRVQQILDFTKASQWHHVSTGENPADYASRGASVASLRDSFWFEGPDFLKQPVITYVKPSARVDEGDKEVRAFKVETEKSSVEALENMIKKLSSLEKLLKAVSGVRQVARKARGENVKTQSPLEEREECLQQIVKRAQEAHFPQSTRRTSVELRKLDYMYDDVGVMRVGGRLRNSPENHNIKHPVILPKKSHLSCLLALKYHENCGHQGRTTTMSAIRSAGYWIVGLRSVVSSVIHHCIKCTRQRGQPAGQKMADLPEERTQPAPPFSHTGIDCFGPFEACEGRRNVKRWGLIFTCLASRAIHLEVLEDMTTDAFLCALRRFIALRGNVKTLRSDMGTNFVGAAKELKKSMNAVNKEKISEEMLKRNCEFVFNPPTASHFGGAWERIIRTVREVMQGLLSKHGSRLTTTALVTLFCEVAAIVNNRPLTTDDLDDPHSTAPLTPNHLLTIKPEPIFPLIGLFDEADLYCRKRWRRVQYLLEQFWSRWRLEYLASLQTRRKWYHARDAVRTGMLVLVVDESLPRGLWKMARVEKVYPSGDGLVRSVQLRIASAGKDGSVNVSFLDRPVHKMVPLPVTVPQ